MGEYHEGVRDIRPKFYIKYRVTWGEEERGQPTCNYYEREKMCGF